MNTTFRASFTRDVKKIKDAKLLARIEDVLSQVEAATTLSEIPNVSKMEGSSIAYRIRVGNYRIGFYYQNDIVEFVRCLLRKDIYRYFP